MNAGKMNDLQKASMRDDDPGFENTAKPVN